MYSMKTTKNTKKKRIRRKVRELFLMNINLNNEENNLRSTLSVGSNVISIPALLLGF
jgi:hypothetical protein